MAAPVTVLSKEQLLGRMVRVISSSSDVTDFAPGGALVTLLEAVAQRQYLTQVQVLKIVEQSDIDNLVGTRLDDVAQSILLPNGLGGIGRKPATPASGSVTIRSGFSKITTKFYQGKPPAYAGATTLYLQDATGFPEPTGNPSIYLGRNSLNNFEGPIQYSALVNNGSFWTMTLAAPLTKNHDYNDELTLAQGGDRTVPSGTVVLIPARDGRPQISYTTDVSTTIFDGEAESSVTVTCTNAGTSGNAAVNAIATFTSDPFDGSAVANLTAFANGEDTEKDSGLRQRIKDYPATLSRGTEASLRAALNGLVDPVSRKAITSVSVVRPTTSGEPTTFYIDDGSGLEPTFGFQNYELLLAKASGQEQSFRTAQAPVTPVVITGAEEAPFDLSNVGQLNVLVDGTTLTFQVNAANYSDLRAATSYEVVRDFNAQNARLAWRTVNGGKYVTLFDALNTAEEIQVSSGTLQTALGLTTIPTRSIYVYKNGVLQSYNGKTATLTTSPFPWTSPVGTNYQVRVDQVTTPITFSISDADFVPASALTATLAQWATVLRRKIPGVTITVVGNRLLIASNLDRSNDSFLEVTGDFVGSGRLFVSATSVNTSDEGSSQDYEFNRYTGDIRFVDKVEADSVVEIASTKTRAYVDSTRTETGTYDLTSSSFGRGRMLVVPDAQTTVRTIGTAISLAATDLGNNLCEILAASSTLFTNVVVGDYLYFVNNQVLNAPLGESANGLYIVRAASASQVTVEASDSQIAALTAAPLVYSAGMVQAFASPVLPTEVLVPSSVSGPVSVAQLAQFINAQAIGFSADEVGGQSLRLRTASFTLDSTISVVAITAPLSGVFSITENEPETLQSHVGFASPTFSDSGLPVISGVVSENATRYLKTFTVATDVTLNADPAVTDPTIQEDASVTSYPVGFSELYLTGKAGAQRFRVYNTTSTAPFAGFARGGDVVRFPETVSTPDRGYYANFGLRLEDLPLTNVDKLVVTLDLDSTNKRVSLPLFKRALVESVAVSPTGGKGDVITVTLKDPDDSDRPFFDTFSAYRNFNFEDFRLLSRSVGVYLPNGLLSTVGLALHSKTFGGQNRLRFSATLASNPDESTIALSHSNDFKAGEVQTTLSATIPSGPQIPNSLYASGAYGLRSDALVNNVRTMTLSSETTAAPAFTQLGTYTFVTASTGTNQNNSNLKISNNNASPATPVTVTDTPGLPWTVEVNLNGNSPSLATLQALSSTFIDFASTTGTGAFSLQPLDGSYNPGSKPFAVIPTASGAMQFQSILSSTLENGWTVTITSTGAAAATFTGSAPSWTLDLKGNTLNQTQMQTLINGNAAFSGRVAVTGTGTISPAQVPSPVALSLVGGINPSNLKQVTGGTDASTGAFDDAAFQVGNLLKIGGTVVPSQATPIGTFPITGKAGGQITVKVPDYTGLYSSGTFATVSASIFPVSSFAYVAKTWDDFAAAVNAYQASSLIASATGLGASATTDFVDPTYIARPNSASLPSSVTTVSAALDFHAFECNASGYGSVISYDAQANAVQVLVQTDGAIFPTAVQAPTGLYTAIDEETFLVPSNNATLARWASFAAASTLPLFANVTRLSGDKALQISSLGVGSQSAVQTEDTYANDWSEFLLATASTDDASTSVSVLTRQAEALAPKSLVRVTNSIATDSIRPYATPSTVVTNFNPADTRPWFTVTSRVFIDNNVANTSVPDLVMLRIGQDTTGAETNEPLKVGDQVTTTLLGDGLVRFSLSGTGVLAARVGDMLYVARTRGGFSSPFAADVRCVSPVDFGFTPSGNKVITSSSGMIPYLGYPVVEVESATSVIVIAPRLTTAATVVIGATHRRALLFIPTPWAEKNIRTSVWEGARRTEGISQPTFTDTYAVMRRIRDNFFALTLSNTSLTATPSVPDWANDDLVLKTMGVSSDDKVVLGPLFAEANQGDWTLIAHDEKNTLILHRDLGGSDEYLDPSVLWYGKKVNSTTPATPFFQRPVRILDADSVRVGSQIRISTGAGFANSFFTGSWTVSDIGWWLPAGATDDRSLAPYVTINLGNSVATGSTYTLNPAGVSFKEAAPLSVFRMVAGFSPNAINTENADLYLLPNARTERLKTDLGTSLTAVGKLALPTEPQTGVDGYKIFSGLVQEAHKVLDGVPSALGRYAGVKAAGTDVAVLTPLLKSIKMTLKIRTRDGISINVVADIVRSAVSSFVLDQPVGQAIVISDIVSLVSDISGVASVEVTATTPASVDGYIPLAESEKAIVLNGLTDIEIEG